jgi:hypothetical protein
MTDPLRMTVLVALMAFVVSSITTASAVTRMYPRCKETVDCRKSEVCSLRSGNKTGFCVGASTKKHQQKHWMSITCERDDDCPLGDFCSVKHRHKTGICAR